MDIINNFIGLRKSDEQSLAVLKDIQQMTEANAREKQQVFVVPAKRFEAYRDIYDAVTLSPYVIVKTE